MAKLPVAAAAASPLSFAAMRHAGFRAYFFTYMLAMMADNIEHVISYWMMFQKFHSPALGGFAVLSHWLPFLFFSVPVGALADRADPRRIIQAGMVLFITASLGWGYFFVTDSLQMWQAMLLLVIHGCAGVLWQTSSQLLLHDIVPASELPSAVRLNATARYLGVLVGPAVGGVMQLGLGPAHGMLLNTVYYLPLVLWLWKAPYGPRFRQQGAAVARRAVKGVADIVQTMRDVADQPVIVSMILLAGAASFFVGNSYQAQMPGFAQDLGHGDPGTAYSTLLAADAAGARGVRARKHGPVARQPEDRTVPGDGMVRGAGQLRDDAKLLAGADAAVRGRLLRAGVRQHGAGAGATQCAGRDPWPRDRPLQHVGARPARVQRHHGRAGRHAGRRSLVAGGLGALHAGPDGVPGSATGPGPHRTERAYRLRPGFDSR